GLSREHRVSIPAILVLRPIRRIDEVPTNRRDSAAEQRIDIDLEGSNADVRSLKYLPLGVRPSANRQLFDGKRVKVVDEPRDDRLKLLGYDLIRSVVCLGQVGK